MIKHVVLTLMFALLLVGCKTTNNPATIPAGEAVSAPAASVPAEYARYSGLWVGSWGNGAMDGKLMVQTIDPKGKVEALYAWGDSSQWNITAGATRAKGAVAGTVLTLDPFGNGARVHYELQADGSLKGFYERNRQITIGQFVK